MQTMDPLLSRVWRWGDGFGQFGETRIWPWIDLAIRIYLAQIYWVSGILKVLDWDQALILAADQAPAGWLAPVTAAYIGAIIQLIAPVLLAFGLLTRFAALPMALLAITVEFTYLSTPVHHYWALLFGWYVVMGAGPLSIDHLLARGVSDSAIPLASPIARFCAGLTTHAGPFYGLLLRVWLAVILVRAALGWIGAGGPDLAVGVIQIALALCLAAGFLTRTAAWILIVMIGTMYLMGTAHGHHHYWAGLLAILAVCGAGPLALDRLLRNRAERWSEEKQAAIEETYERRPHVVIVGAGFGGMAAARGLAECPCRMTIIDRRNYHLFQPLLYQVATAGLSPANIAAPIRELFRHQRNVRVLLGRVTDIDVEAQEVKMGDAGIGYDYLVVGTGARHNYFGKDHWEEVAPGLKKIDDATDIRHRILLAFERAENSDDPDQQAAHLTFIVVGGGPTGVEMAGAIAELASHGMQRDFRNINPTTARIILVQAGDRLLPPFPPSLSEKTKEQLEDLGVEVMLNARADDIDGDGITIGDERIPAKTVIWAAGVIASPAAKWLGAEADRAGRVMVGDDLSVPDHGNVFVIGDTCHSLSWNGNPMPGVAPAAKQCGTYVAKVISAKIRGAKPPKPFRYNHAGNLATIGRKAAVADLGWLKLSGSPAWWFWGAVHVFFLAGMRNRAQVMMEWFWAYLTFRRSTRLITSTER